MSYGGLTPIQIYACSVGPVRITLIIYKPETTACTNEAAIFAKLNLKSFFLGLQNRETRNESDMERWHGNENRTKEINSFKNHPLLFHLNKK